MSRAVEQSNTALLAAQFLELGLRYMGRKSNRLYKAYGKGCFLIGGY